MEQRNQELFPEWKQAADDIVGEYTYGDLVTLDWLYDHLHIEKPTKATEEQFKAVQFRLLNDIESIKSELLTEHQIYMTNVRGQGYLLVNPNDQSDIVWHKMKKALFKALRQSGLGLVHIKHDMLSSDARRSNTNKLTSLASLRMVTMRGIRDERKGVLQPGAEDSVSKQGTGNDGAGKTEEEKEQE